MYRVLTRGLCTRRGDKTRCSPCTLSALQTHVVKYAQFDSFLFNLF